MKRFKDLTEKEVLEINTFAEPEFRKTIDHYLDLELMVNGVVKVDEPKFDLEKPDIEDYTDTYYKHKYTGLVSLDISLLEFISEKIKDKKFVITHYETPHNLLSVTQHTDYHTDIVSQNVFTNESHRDMYVTKLVEYRDTKRKYEEDYEKYQEYFNKKTEYHREIINILREVVDKYHNMKIMLNRYKEYLTLSDNNHDIAWKFLNKTYTIDSHTRGYILSHFPEFTELQGDTSDEE